MAPRIQCTDNNKKKHSLSLEDNQSLGIKIETVKSKYGLPPTHHVWALLFALFICWAATYMAAYLVLAFVLFPNVDNHGSVNITDTARQPIANNDLPLTDSFWYADMDATNFCTFVAMLSWTIVLVTGIGLEIFVWHTILKDGWSSEWETKWRLAQFVFPVLGMTCMGLAFHQNSLAVLLTIVWLWKFGFPETVSSVHAGLFNTKLLLKDRVADFINGIGTFLHHSSAALSVCVLAAGLPHKPWQPRTLLMSAFLAVSQHLLCPIYYAAPNLYIPLVLCLEVFFEWGLISDVENVYKANWLIGLLAVVMIFAHWLYLFAGLLNLIPSKQAQVTSKSEQETESDGDNDMANRDSYDCEVGTNKDDNQDDPESYFVEFCKVAHLLDLTKS